MDEDWDETPTSAFAQKTNQYNAGRYNQSFNDNDNWNDSEHADLSKSLTFSRGRGRYQNNSSRDGDNRRGGRGRGSSNFEDRNQSGRDDGSNWRSGRNNESGAGSFADSPNRPNGDAGYGGIARNDSITMHVQERYVGRIIGRGGTTIKQLQSDSGARIKVSRDSSNGEVPVEISGDEEAMNRARDMIDDLISGGGGGGGGGYNRGREENNVRPGGGNETVVKMDVSTTDTGRVIGKGGEKIRQLQTEFRVRIKILQDEGDRFSTPIELTGDSDDCERARKAINDHLGYKEKADDFTAFVPGQSSLIDWDAVREASKDYHKIKFKDCPVVYKDFYIEDPEVTNMPRREAERIRFENNNIMIEDLDPEPPGPIPNPIVTFEQAFKHYPEILREIRGQGFQDPSPIQKQGWPIILQGRDLIAVAQTGTGKTLLFLLPAFIHIEGQAMPRSERKGPTVLVLSPTRELALQIESEVKKYQYKGIKCVCVYGGGSRKNQINIVAEGVEIIVATPGRLNDLVMNEIVTLKYVSYLVLDEADRMLDMGFENEIKKLLLDIRPDRQTIMTSATWPPGVQDMADQYLHNPIKANVGSLDLAAVHSVRQIVEVLDSADKRDRLDYFLKNELGPNDKVIVFCGRKSTADDISSDLVLSGLNVQSLHGDREQCDREQALADLKSGDVHILIATDVAARGLDVVDITHVFNFDFPRHMEEYVHRVGRTGRAGRTGVAITLMTREDWRQAGKLIKIMEEANQEIPEALIDMAERWERNRERRAEEGGGRGGGRGFGRRGGRGFGRNRHEDACTINFGIA